MNYKQFNTILPNDEIHKMSILIDSVIYEPNYRFVLHQHTSSNLDKSIETLKSNNIEFTEIEFNNERFIYIK